MAIKNAFVESLMDLSGSSTPELAAACSWSNTVCKVPAEWHMEIVRLLNLSSQRVGQLATGACPDAVWLRETLRQHLSVVS